MSHKWVVYKSHVGHTFEYIFYLLQTSQFLTSSQPCPWDKKKWTLFSTNQKTKTQLCLLLSFCDESQNGFWHTEWKRNLREVQITFKFSQGPLKVWGDEFEVSNTSPPRQIFRGNNPSTQIMQNKCFEGGGCAAPKLETISNFGRVNTYFVLQWWWRQIHASQTFGYFRTHKFF